MSLSSKQFLFLARLILCGFVASVVPGQSDLHADGANAPGGVAGIAAREAQRRQQLVQSAQTLFTAGSRAFADRSYGEAMDNFKAAFETVPDVPAVADQRRVFFKRYQDASLAFANLKIDEARWAEAEQVLEDVINTASRNSVPDSLVDYQIREMLTDLREHDDRYNMAESPRHLENVELVKSKLILAKGYLELGDYDRAERTYHEVLAVDRFSSAARRGLENVERHRMDYYEVSRNYTRSKMLREVAEGWETAIPVISSGDEVIGSDTETANGSQVLIQQKLNSIIIPQIEFNGARIADVLSMLSTRSQELDTAEPDPAQRGVGIVLDTSGSSEADSIPDRTLSVRLANVPLASALEYVTRLVGLKYRIDRFAVTVVPENVDLEATLITRTIQGVPPGFISSSGSGAGVGSGPTDPFAEPETTNGIQLRRVSAQEFLEQNGVVFGDGASARFVTATSSLVVRNTAEQIAIVEQLVQAAKDAGSKLVMVRIKTISIEEQALKELGLDWLLGASNVGSTPRVFFGGGVDGNASPGTSAADFTFSQSGIPIGMNPVTAGLRSGNLASGQSISDVINRDAPDAGQLKAPGVFSIAGVFTDPQFQVTLRALNQRTAADQLFDTHVVTKPGQIAKIEQIREFIYPTEYDPPEIPNQVGFVPTGQNVNILVDTVEFPVTPATPTAFETRSLGSVIEVEPTISSDNLTVSLNITADFSDFVGFINYGTPIRNANFLTSGGEGVILTDNRILMPVFEAIKETTSVTVWDGATVAIGGFHGESVLQANDKVPGLGDLPGVGRAFRSSVGDSTKQALLIFVTVNLIDPGGNPINAVPDDPEPEFTRREPISPYSSAGGPPAGIYQAK